MLRLTAPIRGTLRRSRQNSTPATVATHEFEALLFSDCSRFSSGIGRKGLEPEFQRIRDSFPTPEEIDDPPKNAPSKRIRELIPGYQKPFLGTLAALEVGLLAMRTACPHFATWLEQLEHAGIRNQEPC